ncbi:TPA: hypothetical protein DDZ86_00040 [Candidatus Dependentiae bacterium]|nr:MAG: hypothetical protein UW09_C0002G0110 [candidate division TM6 bacterium GW2011_GWF2_43_87]HBL98017.1 hypothetical protein [Candidatus Dependentiae bacterium]
MDRYDEMEERSLFAQLIPLFILFLMVACSFGLHAVGCNSCDEARCVCEDSLPYVTDLKPFNEQSIWIDKDASGHTLICKRRIFLSDYAFREPDIYCSRAVSLGADKVVGAERGDVCWKADGMILCEKPDGSVFKTHSIARR